MKKILLFYSLLLPVLSLGFFFSHAFAQVVEPGSAVISMSPNPPQRGQATTFSAARCPANTVAIFQWENTSSGATDRSTPQRVGPDGRVSYVHAPNFRNAPYVAWVNCGGVLSQRITFNGPVANPDPGTNPDPGDTPTDPGGSDPDPGGTGTNVIDPEPGAEEPSPPERSPIPLPPSPPCAQEFGEDGKCTGVQSSLGVLSTEPQNLIQTLFRILVSISGGIALLIIIRSGYQIMTSRGDPEKIKEARERFTAAVVGLLFLIFSIIILETMTVGVLRLPGFSS